MKFIADVFPWAAAVAIPEKLVESDEEKVDYIAPTGLGQPVRPAAKVVAEEKAPIPWGHMRAGSEWIPVGQDRSVRPAVGSSVAEEALDP